MHGEEGGFAAGGVLVGAGLVDGGVGCAADEDDGVPESDVARGVAGDVYLEDDGAGEDFGDGESHVLNFYDTSLAVIADFDDSGRLRGVLKLIASTWKEC